MMKQLNFGLILIGLLSLSSSAFSVTPDLPVTIPVFDGVGLDDVALGAAEGEVGACTYNLDMTQSISSSRISGTGTISATDFDVQQNGKLVIDFVGNLDFSSIATIAGSVVRLTGAKSRILSLTENGTGTYTENGTEREATVTKVVATFSFKKLTVDLENGTIGGGGDSIAQGPISATGYLNESPNTTRGTIRGSYDAVDFPESEFPSENIVTPEINMEYSTSTKGAISGGGSAAFGNLDDAAFGVKGRRNSKTGISTVTLRGEGAARSFAATLNLNDNGELATGPRIRNSMNAFGYRLRF